MKKQLLRALLLCAFVSLVQYAAAQTASGSAVIPSYRIMGGTSVDRDLNLIISNITGSATDVTITLYNSDGSILRDSSSSPSAGRINYAVGYVAGSYTEGTSSGPSVSFTIAANSTMQLTLTTLHPGTYDEVGYGVIRWSKATSNEVHSIVARGINNMAQGTSTQESLLPINGCLPF